MGTLPPSLVELRRTHSLCPCVLIALRSITDLPDVSSLGRKNIPLPFFRIL
jgi:hypothetical protein